ncbi:MAG: hypothetical protein RR769_03580, partial [Anaerovoracaceae bacterium]
AWLLRPKASDVANHRVLARLLRPNLPICAKNPTTASLVTVLARLLRRHIGRKVQNPASANPKKKKAKVASDFYLPIY